jgi:hypothetical protein
LRIENLDPRGIEQDPLMRHEPQHIGWHDYPQTPLHPRSTLAGRGEEMVVGRIEARRKFGQMRDAAR